MKKLIFTLLALAFATPTYAVDLRDYFPDNNIVILNRADGTNHARYTFQKEPSGFTNLYNTFHNLGLSGYHYLWRKEYWDGSQWVKAVDQILFFADNGAVYETGGWKPSGSGNIVVGYRKKSNTSVNSGLIWSPVGGLTETPALNELRIIQQASPGAAYSLTSRSAYSKVGLVEVIDEYTPKYGKLGGTWGEGNGQTYEDVIRIVMYHGTDNQSPVRCGAVSPVAAFDDVYYQSFSNYNSYGIDLYLAPGVGIIGESTAFIEDATFWGGSIPNCSGDAMDGGEAFSTWIDQ